MHSDDIITKEAGSEEKKQRKSHRQTAEMNKRELGRKIAKQKVCEMTTFLHAHAYYHLASACCTHAHERMLL